MSKSNATEEGLLAKETVWWIAPLTSFGFQPLIVILYSTSIRSSEPSNGTGLTCVSHAKPSAVFQTSDASALAGKLRTWRNPPFKRVPCFVFLKYARPPRRLGVMAHSQPTSPAVSNDARFRTQMERRNIQESERYPFILWRPLQCHDPAHAVVS